MTRALGAVVFAAAAVALVVATYGRDRGPDRQTAEQLTRIEARLAAAPGEPRREAGTMAARELRAGAALERVEARLTHLAAGAVAQAPAPRTPTPEQLQAAAQARALVDRSVAQGRWTEESRHELVRLLGAADHEARDDLSRRLVQAVNAGQLTVDGPIL